MYISEKNLQDVQYSTIWDFEMGIMCNLPSIINMPNDNPPALLIFFVVLKIVMLWTYSEKIIFECCTRVALYPLCNGRVLSPCTFLKFFTWFCCHASIWLFAMRTSFQYTNKQLNYFYLEHSSCSVLQVDAV